MNILQINPVTGRYSTGRSTTELNQYFRKKGHTSYIATAFPTQVDEFRIGNGIDRKIHSLLARITGFEACFSSLPTIALIQYIKKQKPDVVKIGVVHSNYLNYYLLLNFLGKQKIPVVLVLNDCWHYTGKCVHYTYNQCMKWKIGCGDCSHLENGIPTWFFDRTYLLLNKKKKALNNLPKLAVVGVSQWITNEAKQSILRDANIVQRIYNWVDFCKFYPRDTSILEKKLEIAGKKIILGVASIWSESKGLNAFIQLAEKLGKNYAIILVGRLEGESLLKDNITCVGEVHDVNSLAEYYSMADVFVTLSREESFGKVSAEALACGTPVVCFDSTASPELVGDGCGYTARIDDLDDVCFGITEICRGTKGRYRDLCVRYARENFDFETNAEQYLDLFQKLIDKGE